MHHYNPATFRTYIKMTDRSFAYDMNNVEKKDQRAALNFIARTAEAAERYDDMALYMEKLVDLVTGEEVDLNTEERNLLSVAFKSK
jgi:hypothetical protein